MIKSKILLVVSACLVLTGKVLADTDKHFPLPFMVSPDNPLSTITITGTTVNVLQGFPSFNNGLDKVKGTTQYSQKQGLFIGMKLWPGATVYPY